MVQWHKDIAQLTIPTPFAVGDVHVYVIRDEKITLVDTGAKTKEGWKTLKEQLTAIGLSVGDIEQIVLTHHHPDHAGLIDSFPQAEILGAKEGERFLLRDEGFMKEHDAFYTSFFRQMGLPDAFFVLIEKMKEPLQILGNRGLDLKLDHQQKIPGASDWRVINTPGHAQGHISLFRSKDGCMIGGDMLLEKVSSNPLIEPPFNRGGERPIPQLQYNQSLKRLLDLPISLLLPGHGGVIEQPHPLIHHRLKKQHERALHVKHLLAQKESTAFDICVRLFPQVYRKQLGLTLSETMAQLDYLLSIGEIECADQAGDAFIYKALANEKELEYEQGFNR
ncbi:MBL fold metallo-hydrolase [Jeotgalibacillus sp. S-D1]|uniref:MBL fold metallo-hydrolase n=1 Tax=Jeotgalibacillus sp. S-D1 TaxID=2552189 RepID=UPI00105A451D|nr:MBL fold metallo-hydrolase [Jeotgalibacillus sp. S-D1]TDL34666.1 MBL fold metallo-hydrolase [Jeotgalibacillus sp. S-D1]